MNKPEGATLIIKYLSYCRRFSMETALSKGGLGTALSLNLNQAISLRSNKPPTLDGERDTYL